MGEINFFGISSRSSAQRLAIIKKYQESNVSTSYMQYGQDYFDNPDHPLGYHGYKYDGRYALAVSKIVEHYRLMPGMSVLEIGCAKGFVLVEFLKLGMKIAGFDYSQYALANSHPDVKKFVSRGSIDNLPFKDEQFDLVIAKEILPHVPHKILRKSLRECKRVSKGNIFFEIQCGRTEHELEYMKLWDRTHQVAESPSWWSTVFEEEKIQCDAHYNILVSEED
jgi:SAM-dependent methyltransferase